MRRQYDEKRITQCSQLAEELSTIKAAEHSYNDTILAKELDSLESDTQDIEHDFLRPQQIITADNHKLAILDRR